MSTESKSDRLLAVLERLADASELRAMIDARHLQGSAPGVELIERRIAQLLSRSLERAGLRPAASGPRQQAPEQPEAAAERHAGANGGRGV